MLLARFSRIFCACHRSAYTESSSTETSGGTINFIAELTSSGMITFWLKPPTLKRRVYDKAARFYNIDPVYHAWGAQGIIAFIVAIHFDEAHTPRFLGVPVETPSSRTAYRQAVVEWLTTRNYPAELVEPFHTNSPNQSLQPTAGRSDD